MRFSSIVYAFMSIFLSACEGGNLPTLVYSSSNDDDGGRYPKAQPFNLDTDRLPGSPLSITDPTKTEFLVGTNLHVSISPANNSNLLAIDLARTSKFFRNELQNELLSRSDSMCGLFKDRMNQINSVADFALLGSAVAFASAATIVVGDRAKDILAGLSGTSAGLVAAKDSAFLMNQLISTVFQQIDTSRAALLDKIHAKQKDGLDTYSPGRAISDAVRYHELCNLPPAISGLSTSIKAAFDKDAEDREAALLLDQQTRNAEREGKIATLKELIANPSVSTEKREEATDMLLTYAGPEEN